MRLTCDVLLGILQTFPECSNYWLAFSGGRDSHVLLHLLAAASDRLPAGVTAVHVNHGLQPESASWEVHCRCVCETLRVPFLSLPLGLTPTPGESIEAIARKARYRALSALMGKGDLLLTAHHREDQAETVMLQLLRGAGPAGLAAMPVITQFGPGYHGRPLLEMSETDVSEYARANDLQWIEDPSNGDDRFDRNFLRNQVLPLLRQKWPALSRTISRSARHCGEAQSLVDRFAGQLLDRLIDPASGSLDLSELLLLPPSEGRAVIRLWVKAAGLPVPSTAHLDRVLGEMSAAAVDRNPLVRWPGSEVRRYRRRLYIRSPLPALDTETVLVWDGETSLGLPAGLGRLELERDPRGISLSRWRQADIELRFRRPGERMRIAGRDDTRSLKKYFQQQGIPPWVRARIPLIYLDGRLAAVAGLCICDPFAAAEGEEGVALRWRGHGLSELGARSG